MLDVEVLIISRRYESTRKCVESVLAFSNCRVLVVVNGVNALTEYYLSSAELANPSLRHISFEQKLEKSRARNAALDVASGEILYFIDDDAYAAEDQAGLASKIFEEHPEVSFIGGPNLTPPSSEFFQRIAGYVLSSPFAALNMRLRFARVGGEAPCDDSALTLCNLAFRRKVFEEDGIYFDHRLYYNEENLFLQLYKAKGRKMLYCPSLAVYHERRRSFLSFAEQVFRSGEGRAMMTLIMPESVSAVYLMPFIFTAYTISVPFNGTLYRLPLLVYIIISVMNAFAVVHEEREKLKAFSVMLFMPFAAHISYGLGFALGLVRYLLCRK